LPLFFPVENHYFEFVNEVEVDLPTYFTP